MKHSFKILILLIITSFIYCSCDTSIKKKINFTRVEKVEKKVIVKRLNMNFPGSFIVTDSLIIVNNPFSPENVLEFYDKGSGEFLFAGARKGNGPDEILTSTGLDYRDSRIQVLDPNLRKYFEYKIDIKNSKVVPKVISLKEFEQQITSIFKISSNQYVTNSNKLGNLFSTINLSTKKCDNFGAIPIVGSEKIININDRFQGSLKVNQSGLYFVFGAFSTPYLCLYALQDGSFNKKFELYITEPKYKISNKKLFWDDENITGFLDIAISDNRIYALHSSLRKKDVNGRSISSLPKTIYEFDIEGKPVCKYETEDHLIRLTCDRSGKLYSIILDEKDKEFKVVEFLLD